MGEYIHVKKAIYPKDGFIFDFILLCSNNDSKIKNSLLLAVLKPKVKISNNTNSKTIQVKFNFMEILLKENAIKGYIFLFSSLSRNFLLHCPLWY